MRLLAATVSALLAACAPHDLRKVAEPHAVEITWLRRAPTSCGHVRTNESTAIHGCAHRSPDWKRCVVEMREDAPDHVVAEEFRHCFGFDH